MRPRDADGGAADMATDAVRFRERVLAPPCLLELDRYWTHSDVSADRTSAIKTQSVLALKTA
eukprot:COSAG01_NODE_55816_length_322_cov_1.376682_2_plen_61_part_01